MLTLSQVDSVIREIFDETLVKSVETVYQKVEDDNDELIGYLLVISLHAIEIEDTIIIHTKFNFPVNNQKSGLTENTFSYLRDLSCEYKHVEFEEDSKEDLKNKIEKIIFENDFSDDLKILSDFLVASTQLINNYLYQKDIEKFSVHSVHYNPRFKITSCENMTYDFDLNVNNNEIVNLSIKKIEDDNYQFQFKYKEVETKEVDSIVNIEGIIGEYLINIFN